MHTSNQNSTSLHRLPNFRTNCTSDSSTMPRLSLRPEKGVIPKQSQPLSSNKASPHPPLSRAKSSPSILRLARASSPSLLLKQSNSTPSPISKSSALTPSDAGHELPRLSRFRGKSQNGSERLRANDHRKAGSVPTTRSEPPGARSNNSPDRSPHRSPMAAGTIKLHSRMGEFGRSTKSTMFSRKPFLAGDSALLDPRTSMLSVQEDPFRYSPTIPQTVGYFAESPRSDETGGNVAGDRAAYRSRAGPSPWQSVPDLASARSFDDLPPIPSVVPSSRSRPVMNRSASSNSVTRLDRTVNASSLTVELTLKAEPVPSLSLRTTRALAQSALRRLPVATDVHSPTIKSTIAAGGPLPVVGGTFTKPVVDVRSGQTKWLLEEVPRSGTGVLARSPLRNLNLTNEGRPSPSSDQGFSLEDDESEDCTTSRTSGTSSLGSLIDSITALDWHGLRILSSGSQADHSLAPEEDIDDIFHTPLADNEASNGDMGPLNSLSDGTMSTFDSSRTIGAGGTGFGGGRVLRDDGPPSHSRAQNEEQIELISSTPSQELSEWEEVPPPSPLRDPKKTSWTYLRLPLIIVLSLFCRQFALCIAAVRSYECRIWSGSSRNVQHVPTPGSSR